MLQQLLQWCTSDSTLMWTVIGSDLAIALAYFAIPLTMAVVLRHRSEDIPYPWLWVLFVTFIVACGLTHIVHVWSALSASQNLWLHAGIGMFTALASVGTAIAFATALPQIKLLPSPRQQRAQLEQAVAERTAEKDKLIREINHRIGNQLQILSSIVNVERRRAKDTESLDLLDRFKRELDTMAKNHATLSSADYLRHDAPAAVPGSGFVELRQR
jgi:hypothetical protein